MKLQDAYVQFQAAKFAPSVLVELYGKTVLEILLREDASSDLCHYPMLLLFEMDMKCLREQLSPETLNQLHEGGRAKPDSENSCRAAAILLDENPIHALRNIAIDEGWNAEAATRRIAEALQADNAEATFEDWMQTAIATASEETIKRPLIRVLASSDTLSEFSQSVICRCIEESHPPFAFEFLMYIVLSGAQVDVDQLFQAFLGSVAASPDYALGELTPIKVPCVKYQSKATRNRVVKNLFLLLEILYRDEVSSLRKQILPRIESFVTSVIVSRLLNNYDDNLGLQLLRTWVNVPDQAKKESEEVLFPPNDASRYGRYGHIAPSVELLREIHRWIAELSSDLASDPARNKSQLWCQRGSQKLPAYIVALCGLSQDVSRRIESGSHELSVENQIQLKGRLISTYHHGFIVDDPLPAKEFELDDLSPLDIHIALEGIVRQPDVESITKMLLPVVEAAPEETIPKEALTKAIESLHTNCLRYCSKPIENCLLRLLRVLTRNPSGTVLLTELLLPSFDVGHGNFVSQHNIRPVIDLLPQCFEQDSLAIAFLEDLLKLPHTPLTAYQIEQTALTAEFPLGEDAQNSISVVRAQVSRSQEPQIQKHFPAWFAELEMSAG